MVNTSILLIFDQTTFSDLYSCDATYLNHIGYLVLQKMLLTYVYTAVRSYKSNYFQNKLFNLFTLVQSAWLAPNVFFLYCFMWLLIYIVWFAH